MPTATRVLIESVSAALGLALLGIVALTLTGSVAWVITTGDSMEPGFRSGDVAVVRPAADYAVGDVIAYHNGDLQQIVLHRVIDEVDGLLVTQGDNNEWVDSYRPRPDEVLGTLRLHMPGLGRVLRMLFEPAFTAALVFAGTVLLLSRGSRQPTGAADAPAEVG